MKKCCLIILVVCSAFSTYAAYNWQQLTSMPSYGRAGTAGFAIGNKVYYGLGDFNYTMQFSDLWEYDPQLDTWTQKADFIGSARVSTTFFSLNGNGYIGLGWSSYVNSSSYNNFYKYDAASNTWTAVSSYPGAATFNAISFVINGFAYTGLGGSSGKDIYKYDPINDTWTGIAAFPGGAIQSASAFSVNNSGFVYGGWDGFSMIDELWAYDPLSNQWTQKTSAPVSRSSCIAFTIDNTAFVGTGADITGTTTSMYKYDAANNSWSPAPSFPGVPHAGFRASVIGNTAYGFGGDEAGIGYYCNEIWKFSNVTGIDNLNYSNTKVFYYQNALHIDSKEQQPFSNIEFYSLNGERIFSVPLNSKTTTICLTDYTISTGNYLYSIYDSFGKIKSSGKIFIL
jgi:N-acetylneuraminic acid mutarotase